MLMETTGHNGRQCENAIYGIMLFEVTEDNGRQRETWTQIGGPVISWFAETIGDNARTQFVEICYWRQQFQETTGDHERIQFSVNILYVGFYFF